MDTVLWLPRIAIFWLVTVPLLTLIHELGHAAAGLLTTRGEVTVSIGTGGKARTISLGRLSMELCLFSSLIGFCTRENASRSRSGEVLFYGAGPMFSLISAATPGYLGSSLSGDSSLGKVLLSASFGAFWQLIVTLVPVRYPS